MAQLVERVLGKDEVPGPNPGSSSRKNLVIDEVFSSEPTESRLYLPFCAAQGAAGQSTHSMTSLIISDPLLVCSLTAIVIYSAPEMGTEKGNLSVFLVMTGDV